MKLFYKYDKDSQYCKNFSAILQHCRSATLIAMLPVLLSGCMGVYEGGFECPPGQGVGCKSISDVNSLVNAGEIPPPMPSSIFLQKTEIWYAPAFIQEHVKHKRTYGKVPF